MPTLNGDATFSGAGDLAPFDASLNLWVASLGTWSASGSLAALAVKPANHIAARFAGSSSMNVVTIAPRLVASARFVGDGSFNQRPNSAGHVLSTQHTRRLSFPVDPSLPFVRRPSATYHNASVRFSGNGGLIALAS